ncbi:hypothetical protein CLG96_00650 [Sphingomonas oleivorans]|uniref:Uncharacterized protein n=1 Tax=Sphingomonas oleivorans TaxID=1735121 RepID=A0A2T5G0M3_9SPHN|nr:hypothetical protein [Sphingomonas oleivorans]PTQ12706.1 hypothetical protein CLG96_00650 [Sphingomonas oleivorans]
MIFRRLPFLSSRSRRCAVAAAPGMAGRFLLVLMISILMLSHGTMTPAAVHHDLSFHADEMGHHAEHDDDDRAGESSDPGAPRDPSEPHKGTVAAAHVHIVADHVPDSALPLAPIIRAAIDTPAIEPIAFASLQMPPLLEPPAA